MTPYFPVQSEAFGCNTLIPRGRSEVRRFRDVNDPLPRRDAQRLRSVGSRVVRHETFAIDAPTHVNLSHVARTRYTARDAQTKFTELPAAALRAVLREGYTLDDFRHDALAGLVVGVVALPLSMALGVAVGVPPQYGLYTAIVAGFVVALLGGSRTQVSGPTAAFVVVLAPIYARFGHAGLVTSGLLAGVILVLMGVFRLGKFIEFVPHPVTTGFTAGIATVIATLQLKDLFGLTVPSSPEHFADRVSALWDARHTVTLWDPVVGFFTLAVLLVLPRLTRRVPAPVIALPAAALLAAVASRVFPDFQVATIASRFHTQIGDLTISGIPRLPPLPVVPWAITDEAHRVASVTLGDLRALVSSALAIAMLGAIESLLSAVVADGMARTRHDADAELIALGVGNLAVPFVGGVAATGAIARTATNVKSGARSPIAAMLHALTILLAILLFAPVLGTLPMASLAALLVVVAWNMAEVKHVFHSLGVAPRSDVAVLVTCYLLTVLFDMVVGVAVGMVLASFLFMRRMAEVTGSRVSESHHPGLPSPLPRGVVVYEITGPLFFGAAQKAMSNLHVIGSGTRAVIVMMDAVTAMDATGLVALESGLATLRRDHILVILCGVREQPLALLQQAKVLGADGVTCVADAEEALEIARGHSPR